MTSLVAEIVGFGSAWVSDTLLGCDGDGPPLFDVILNVSATADWERRSVLDAFSCDEFRTRFAAYRENAQVDCAQLSRRSA
jgi:hypothetical protein